MPFSLLAGNAQAKSLLEKLSISEKDSHVLLFSGPKGVGKKSFAKAFGCTLLGEKHCKKIQAGIHPDVVWLKPEGKLYTHSLASIEQMLKEVSLSPFEATKKMYILEDAEKMLPFSSNALLKILEEPPSHVSFILVTAHEELMLPTIISRCSKIPFFPISEEEIVSALLQRDTPLEQAKSAALLSQGSFSLALASISADQEPIRAAFLSILRLFFLRRSSKELLEALESMDKWCDGAAEEEGKVAYALEKALEDLLFWVRDLHYRSVDTSPKYLFFPSETPFIPSKLPSLEAALVLIEEAQLALQRSLRPKIVLERLFSKIITVTR